MRPYKLVDRKPVPLAEGDYASLGKAMMEDNRRVGHDEKDGVRVSTVFLALDHSFGGGPPLLFETMIFGGKHDQYQERYCTWGEAEAGHKRACELAGLSSSKFDNRLKPVRYDKKNNKAWLLTL